MIPAAFEYDRASSVDEAIDLLQKYGSDAKLLAGGHSLIPTMRLRLARPSNVIDIGRIPELSFIRDDGDTLVIGANTTHDAIASSPVVQAKAPVLASAAASIGDLQVRNVGTIGGAVAHADPAADYPAAIVTSEAVIVAKGPNGERTISAADFFVEIFTTALQEEEVITEIRVPAQPANSGSVYHKFPNPASGYAVVGCAAMVTVENGSCADVRVGFTGLANTAFRDSGVENALKGQAPDESNISAAADNAGAGQTMLSDIFASDTYRAHLAKVYAKRALIAAAANAD